MHDYRASTLDLDLEIWLMSLPRYILKYAIRRLLRYAKYAAVGAIIAAVGGTLLGTVGSGLAFFAAPSIGVGMGIGVITAIAKVGCVSYHPVQSLFWLENDAHD